MTSCLGAEPGEQTSGRRGYRDGTCEREPTTRVGAIELEVSLDREYPFLLLKGAPAAESPATEGRAVRDRNAGGRHWREQAVGNSRAPGGLWEDRAGLAPIHSRAKASSAGGLPGPDLTAVPCRGIPRCTLPAQRHGPDALRVLRPDMRGAGSGFGGLLPGGRFWAPRRPQRTARRECSLGFGAPWG